MVIVTEDLGLWDIVKPKEYEDKLTYVYSVDDIRLLLPKTYCVFDDKLKEEHFNYPNDYIILPNVDKRTKLYKDNKDNILFLQEINNIDYILQNSNLNKDQAERLNIECKKNLSIITKELEKINLTNIISNYNYMETDVTQTVRAIILNQEFRYKNTGYYLLVTLSNTCKNILCLQNTGKHNLSNFEINQVQDLVGVRDNDWLLKTINLCYKLDKDLREFKIDDKTLFRYLKVYKESV